MPSNPPTSGPMTSLVAEIGSGRIQPCVIILNLKISIRKLETQH